MGLQGVEQMKGIDVYADIGREHPGAEFSFVPIITKAVKKMINAIPSKLWYIEEEIKKIIIQTRRRL